VDEMESVRRAERVKKREVLVVVLVVVSVPISDWKENLGAGM
jgi:hypothetical protein